MTKRLLFLFCILAVTGFALQAQSISSKRPSPAAEANATIDDLHIAIDYSQPGVKDRTVWGVLVPYGKVWRTGANEATTFEINEDVLIEDQLLPAGRYALFSIPEKDNWTIIFNKEADQWGAYNYSPEADVLRMEVPSLDPEFTERMTFDIQPGKEKNAIILMRWGNRAFSFEVKSATQP